LTGGLHEILSSHSLCQLGFDSAKGRCPQHLVRQAHRSTTSSCGCSASACYWSRMALALSIPHCLHVALKPRCPVQRKIICNEKARNPPTLEGSAVVYTPERTSEGDLLHGCCSSGEERFQVVGRANLHKTACACHTPSMSPRTHQQSLTKVSNACLLFEQEPVHAGCCERTGCIPLQVGKMCQLLTSSCAYGLEVRSECRPGAGNVARTKLIVLQQLCTSCVKSRVMLQIW